MNCRAAWILALIAVMVPLYLFVCFVACVVGALVVAALTAVFSETVVVAAVGVPVFWVLVVACVVCGAAAMFTFVVWTFILSIVSARCPRGLV